MASLELGGSEGGTVLAGMLGPAAGAAVGLRLGDPDGARVGEREGCSELYSAALVGTIVGGSDRHLDGAKLGVLVGAALGGSEGSTVSSGYQAVPGGYQAAMLVVAAPQVAYLPARLGFTLRDDTISYVIKP